MTTQLTTQPVLKPDKVPPANEGHVNPLSADERLLRKAVDRCLKAQLGEVLERLEGGAVEKGGEGSGNFGHEERPGLVGGSGPGGGVETPLKLMTPDGGHIPLYHGTRSVFSEFNTPLVHLTADQSRAEHYARSERGGRTLQVTANIKNPKYVNDAPHEVKWNEWQQIRKEGYDAMVFNHGGRLDVVISNDLVLGIEELKTGQKSLKSRSTKPGKSGHCCATAATL
jgi:hypothetical protein